jgi:hypothetical protein
MSQRAIRTVIAVVLAPLMPAALIYLLGVMLALRSGNLPPRFGSSGELGALVVAYAGMMTVGLTLHWYLSRERIRSLLAYAGSSIGIVFVLSIGIEVATLGSWVVFDALSWMKVAGLCLSAALVSCAAWFIAVRWRGLPGDA